MMVGRQEGRFLELLVFATQASSVLEIGTFTGYSAIAMAAGLGSEGSIISLEVDPHHAQVARGNIAAAGLESHISVIEGPALRSLGELQGPFDLVFIDADKVTYDAYYEAVLPKLAQSIVGRAAELADGLSDDPVVAGRVLGEVAESFLNFGVVARREAEQQAELKGAPDVLVTVPFFDADIYDMGGLLRLGAQVWE